ncbi:MAG TPA: murein biosynthesis integral membrane protein MurJ [Anaerolineaceae bacterium]|nr:murein biosynthesis integral membrane protein MurJ [Anaerolineaceae bacterium]
MSGEDLETAPQGTKYPQTGSPLQAAQPQRETAAQAARAESASQQIARATGVVMFAFFLSSLVGVAQQMVITDAFGTSAALDSFNAANRVTELLFNLVAGGALGSAFIPMFTGFLTRDDKRGAWRLASGVLNVVSLILVVVSVLTWIFAPWLVRNGLYALTADSNIGQLEVTVRLLRIMLPTVVIFGISGLVMGMLNAHRSFLIPALAPAMYSLGIILGTVALPKSWGVDRLVYGVLLGASGHLLLQLPSLFRLPERSYQVTAGLKDKAVRQVLRLMLPRLIGAGVVQLNFVANTIIALSLGEGSASAVALAFTLMMMPQRAIAQSAGIASLPTLSAQAELGEYAQMRRTIAKILRGIILLALPASVGLILLRVPLVRVLYERGQFDAESTRMVAWALLWYSAGLLGHCLVEVLSRAFYALHDTRTPVIIGIGAMSLNIALSFLLAAWFRGLGWMPHGGLALANSAATGLESLLLLWLLAKRLKGLEGQDILRGTNSALVGSALMGAALLAWNSLLPQLNNLLFLLGGMGIGVLVYAFALVLMKVPELASVLGALRQRLNARKQRPA